MSSLTAATATILFHSLSVSQHPRFLCLRPTLILYSFRVSPKLAERGSACSSAQARQPLAVGHGHRAARGASTATSWSGFRSRSARRWAHGPLPRARAPGVLAWAWRRTFLRAPPGAPSGDFPSPADPVGLGSGRQGRVPASPRKGRDSFGSSRIPAVSMYSVTQLSRSMRMGISRSFSCFSRKQNAR